MPESKAQRRDTRRRRRISAVPAALAVSPVLLAVILVAGCARSTASPAGTPTTVAIPDVEGNDMPPSPELCAQLFRDRISLVQDNPSFYANKHLGDLRYVGRGPRGGYPRFIENEIIGNCPDRNTVVSVARQLAPDSRLLVSAHPERWIRLVCKRERAVVAALLRKLGRPTRPGSFGPPGCGHAPADQNTNVAPNTFVPPQG